MSSRLRATCATPRLAPRPFRLFRPGCLLPTRGLPTAQPAHAYSSRVHPRQHAQLSPHFRQLLRLLRFRLLFMFRCIVHYWCIAVLFRQDSMAESGR